MIPASENGELQTAAADAVEVILDASGSMYWTLEGRFRYDIAKEVLTDLVTNTLRAETPFALRVFGNRSLHGCRSDLEVALGPLDPAAVSTVIADIVPQPYSGTPLAASLAQLSKDLAGVDGNKTVVLDLFPNRFQSC